MPPLQPTDLFLLSSIMQTIGAIWGILFVVYVFIADYFLREHGAAARAQSSTALLNWLTTTLLPSDRETRKQGHGGVQPSPTRQIREELRRIVEVREGVERNRRVYSRIIAGGILVATSIAIDLAVIWSNDATYLGVAIWGFIAALASLAYVLLFEVWTTLNKARSLLRDLEAARSLAERTRQDALAEVPDE
jgi:hypothetical protein